MTLVQVRQQIAEHLVIPEIFFTIILIIGVISLAVAVILFVISLDYPVPSEKTVYRFRAAKDDELEPLHQLCTEILSEGISDLHTWRQRHKRNPNIFYVVFRQESSPGSSKQEIVGGFSMIPLNQSASELVGEEELIGLQITPDHIPPNGERIASVYIAWLVGRGQKAKGYVISFLGRIMDEYGKSGVTTVYTRPITEDGLRLIKRHTFTPVKNGATIAFGRIHKKETSAI